MCGLLPLFVLALPALAMAYPSYRQDTVSCPDIHDGAYPHPSLCEVYIRCVGMGTAWPAVYEEACPPGLYFNPITGYCDWPDNVHCDPAQSTTTTPSTTTAETRELPLGWVEVPCPGNTVGRYPDPESCSHFLYCTHTGTVHAAVQRFACPAGLHFHPVTTDCDYPGNVPGCDGGYPDIPIDHNTTSTTTTTTETTTFPHELLEHHTLGYLTGTVHDPEVCPGRGDGYYPHPLHCEFFIKCSDMETGWPSVVVLSCPRGLHFNPSIGSCDLPQHVECYIADSTTSTPAESTTENQELPTGWVEVPCPGNTVGRYPDPESCSHFLYCTHTGTVHAAVQRFACPAGLHFHPVTTDCDYPGSVPGCGGPSTTRITRPPPTRIQPTRPTQETWPTETRATTTRPPPTRTYPTRPTQETWPTETKATATRAPPTRTYPTRPTQETWPTETKETATRAPPTRTYPTRPTQETWPTETRAIATRAPPTTTREIVTFETRTQATRPPPTRTYPIPTMDSVESYEVCEAHMPDTPFPDPWECDAYYTCESRNDSSPYLTRHMCPEDQLFDQDLGYCNLALYVDNCLVPLS